MGCDITTYIEVKEGDKWCLLKEHYIDRWYKLFAYIAGVRSGGDGSNNIEPISKDRDLPIDCDPLTKEYLSNEHSQGYLTSDELNELVNHEIFYSVFLFSTELERRKLNNHIDDFRLCFGFDS